MAEAILGVLEWAHAWHFLSTPSPWVFVSVDSKEFIYLASSLESTLIDIRVSVDSRGFAEDKTRQDTALSNAFDKLANQKRQQGCWRSRDTAQCYLE